MTVMIMMMMMMMMMMMTMMMTKSTIFYGHHSNPNSHIILISTFIPDYQVSQLCVTVLQGHVKVLYVSPERLCTQSFRSVRMTVQHSATEHNFTLPTSHLNSLPVLIIPLLSYIFSFLDFLQSFLNIYRHQSSIYLI